MLVPKAATVEATSYPPVAPQTTPDLPHFAMVPLPDTRVVRNLGLSGVSMQRAAIRADLFVFQGPEEACLELCRSRCFVRSAMF